MNALLWWMLLAPPAAVVTEPAWQPQVALLTVPPALEDRLLYARSFDRREPEWSRDVSVVADSIGTVAGLSGLAGATGPGQVLRLRLPAGPEEPLSLAVWWSVAQPVPPQGGYEVLHLTGARGFLSHFGRGGPWCGLADTAAVLQAWDLPGIQGVNAIFDPQVRQTLDMLPGAWHQTVLTVAGGNLLRLYTDGRLSCEATCQGRALAATDQLRQLQVGGSYGVVVWVDELLVWQRTLTAPEVGELHRSTRDLLQAGHLSPSGAGL